jgi:SAM-dependent methyltransferase
MGLDINALKFLLDSKATGTSFERTVTLGRQGLFIEPEALAELVRRVLPQFTLADAQKLLTSRDGFCEPFLEILGAAAPASLDVSDYQSASIIHDMNEAVPPHLHAAFSLVIDSGTLEHIFNTPQAIMNCMQMVRPGGHFVCVTTANNFMGHGFYQFSPELFFRVLSPVNGYAVERMLIYEEYWGDIRFFEVTDPEAIGRRVTLVNRYPTFLLVRARRTALQPIFARTPQQSDYQPVWQDFHGGGRAADAGRTQVNANGLQASGFVWRALKPLVPAALKQRLRRYERGPDAFDRRFYKPVTL